MNVVKNFRSHEKNGNYDQYKNSKGMFTMANIKKILGLPEYKPFALSDADIKMINSSKAGPVAKYVQENWYKQRSKHCYAPVDKRDVRSYINDHWEKLGLDGPVDWTFFSAAQSRSERNTGYGKVQGVPTLITVMCQDGIQNYSKTLKSHCDELKEKGVNMRQLE